MRILLALFLLLVMGVTECSACSPLARNDNCGTGTTSTSIDGSATLSGPSEQCDLGGNANYYCTKDGTENQGAVCVHSKTCRNDDDKSAPKNTSKCQFMDPCVKADGTQNTTCTAVDQYCYKGNCETAGEPGNACKNLSGVQGSLAGICNAGICDANTGLCSKCTASYTGTTLSSGLSCPSTGKPICGISTGTCGACLPGQSYNANLQQCYYPSGGGGTANTPWGTTGVVKTQLSSSDDVANAIAIQSDGKVIVAGTTNNDIFLLRYKTDGTLDTSFDTDGKLTLDIDTAADEGNAVAIQSDGKILVAGASNISFVDNVLLARYNTDGTLDTSFNALGSKPGVYTSNTSPFASSPKFYALAIQTDSKIIAGGIGDNKFIIARFNTNGTLDSSFGSSGVVSTDIQSDTNSDTLRALVIQSDGKIVAVGNSTAGLNNSTAITRYTSAGALDTSFDSDGFIVIDVEGSGKDDEALSVALNSDSSRIVIGGYTDDNTDKQGYLLMYDSNGSAVSGFGTSGKVTFGTSSGEDRVYAVKVASDGNIFASGRAYNSTNSTADSFVRKYSSTGSLVTGFGTSGIATTDTDTRDNYSTCMVIQSDGKIVTAGNTETASNGKDVVVIRYKSDGTLDAQ